MDKWSKDAMKDILRYADGEDEAKKEVEKLEKQVKRVGCSVHRHYYRLD